MSTQFQIDSLDGYPLGATLFEGGDHIILISPAMAVAQSFYAPIARYFQERGHTVLSFDFRGIGSSLHQESLRGFKASVTDWALKDQQAVVNWISRELQPQSLSLVGHSLGGQIAGLLDNPSVIDRMVTLSSQSGYWKLQGGSEPWKVRFHVTFTFPILSRILGYMPWSWFGKAKDLPGPAACQWGSWCRHPEYLFGDPSLPVHRFKTFAAPVLAYSIDDDDWGTAASVDKLMSNYPNLERRHIVPSEFGRDSIGHFGFFRKGSENMWEPVAQWLENS